MAMPISISFTLEACGDRPRETLVKRAFFGIPLLFPAGYAIISAFPEPVAGSVPCICPLHRDG